MPIQLRQTERTVLPTPEVGSIKMPANMYGAEFQAQENMAGAIKQFGGAMADISAKMYQVDVQREQNDFEAKENESQMSMRKFMQDNPDGNFEYDDNGKVTNSTYIQEFNKRQDELLGYANSYKTKHGKELATQRFNANKPIRQFEVDAYSSRDRLEQANASLTNNINTIVNNEVDPVKFDLYRKETGQNITADEYKQVLIKGLVQNAVASRVISPTDAIKLETGAMIQGIHNKIAAMEMSASEEKDPKLAEQKFKDIGLMIQSLPNTIMDDEKKVAALKNLESYQNSTKDNYVYIANQTKSTISTDMVKSDRNKISPSDRFNKVNELKDKILDPNSGIIGDDQAQWLDRIDRWGKQSIAPEVSNIDSIKSMESASVSLTNGIITKAEYYDELTKQQSGLSQSHRDKYVMEAEPAYSKMIQNETSQADAIARVRLVSRTDADMQILQSEVASGMRTQLVLDGQQIKHQAEMLNYTQYQMEVLDEKANPKNKDLSHAEWTLKLAEIERKFAKNDWVSIYKNQIKGSPVLQEFESKISTDYNNSMRKIRKSKGLSDINSWNDLSVDDRAKIVNRIAGGETMDSIFNSVKSSGL